MKGLKLPTKKISVRENDTLADGRMKPAPDTPLPVADLKKRVVQGVFDRPKKISVKEPEPVLAPAQVQEPVLAQEPEQVQEPVLEKVEEVAPAPAPAPAQAQEQIPIEEPKQTRRVVIRRPKEEVKELPQELVEVQEQQPVEVSKPIVRKIARPSNKIVNLTQPGSCDSIPISPAHKKYADSIIGLEKASKYKVPKDTPYQSLNRVFFNRMIPTIYNDYKIKSRAKVDYDACKKMTIQSNTYQEFIREYMRLEAPSRGVLVYHGLGSGKTCSAIGAAEALYGETLADGTPRKIIVMTPSSLRENFINEISFCGFKHYNVKNHWVSFPIMRADGTLDMGVVCLAKSVLHIPDTYIESLKELPDKTKAVIWIPDFDKSANFDILSPSQQDQIKKQIRETIRSRIEFIGYNSTTIRGKLMEIALTDPTHFDNAIIIIDEIHNLGRLMRGKIEKYLVPKTDKKGATQVSYEPVSTKHWTPTVVTKQDHYNAAILWYRLLAEARNSKIIALSGTPIVNYPEEVGIIANILRGYFHCATLTADALDEKQKIAIETILEKNERVDYYSVASEKSGNLTTIFMTLLEPGFKKTYDADGTYSGVVYDGQVSTIEDVVGKVRIDLTSARVAIKGEPRFEAVPLYPVSKKTFTDTFIEDKGEEPHMVNSFLFAKRMSGIISYYKGGRKDYMPMVNRDIVVEVPMSAHMLGPYGKARSGERDAASVKGEGAAVATTETINWGVINSLPDETNKKGTANYRFRSRAMCNFVFPNGIARPFPTNDKDAVKAAAVSEPVYGDKSEEQLTEQPLEVMVEKQEQLEADLAAIEADADAETEPKEEITNPIVKDNGIVGEEISEEEKARLMKMPYDERIRYTVAKLYDNRAQYFNMDASDPKNRLDTYSPKFARIIENIAAAPGSSLVYSQFKTLEGIGILGIAMKANGYEEVRIVMEGDKMKFHPDTAQSFKERPDQPRYMVFSGDEPVIVRQALINIFNMNWDAGLTKELKDVLGPLDKLRATGNKKGEVCRVFMITGAGAEGLSLKNVRAVHIMEPYWNKVRLDQVKGRAVRICSHKDLPRKDRNVDIFTYVSVIEQSMMSMVTEVEYMDGGLTTDQYIYNMSLTKEKVNLEFLDTLQQMAVDCELNKVENNMYRCFAIEGDMENKFLYDPRLEKDIGYSTQTFTETVADPSNPKKQVSRPIKEIQRRIVEKLPRSVLEGQEEELLEKVGDRGLIYTEMIDKDGGHYFGIFTDEELTHPVPFDSSRELGQYEPPNTIGFY